MLIGEQDVAVVAKDKFCNRGNNTFAVGTRDEEYGGVVHYRYFFSAFAISRAALAPDPPVSPVPGCVPLPHKYSRSIGVL